MVFFGLQPCCHPSVCSLLSSFITIPIFWMCKINLFLLFCKAPEGRLETMEPFFKGSWIVSY